MIVNFSDTAEYKQMYSDLFFIVTIGNLPAKFDCHCNSIAIHFSPNVELVTELIILFANVAKKYKCNFNVSNYCDCLIFTFSRLL